MADLGKLVVRIHQAVSFHPAMIRIPETEAVFWPGCALMTLEPRLLDKTLEVLQRAEPGIRMAAACCGNPSSCLFPRQAERRREKLLKLLTKQGVKRIYTACPNCTLQLASYGLDVKPIWPVLAEHLKAADMVSMNGSYLWHDPCPTRKDAVQQEAVRNILTLRGCDWTEPACSGCNTICCGNKNMLHCTDPKKSAKLRKIRISQFPADRTIVSSCEGCLSAFRSEKRETVHLLELLFGKSKSRGWGNRCKNTWK